MLSQEFSLYPEGSGRLQKNFKQRSDDGNRSLEGSLC